MRDGLRLEALGVVLEEEDQQDEDDDAGQRAAREGRRPADPVQQPGDDECGDQVARHAGKPRHLGDQRPAPGREPAGAEPQHADESQRVAAAQQRPGGERGAVGRGEREAELARGEQHHADRQHLLGAEPVDQQADGYLHARVDQQLKDREGGQRGGVHMEAVRRVQAGDAEGGTEDDGDEVDGDADRPDGHRPPAAGRIAGQAERAAGGGAHRTSPRARWENQLTWPCSRPTTRSASPARSASRICPCSVSVLVTRSGWACITATPMRSCRSRSWS